MPKKAKSTKREAPVGLSKESVQKIGAIAEKTEEETFEALIHDFDIQGTSLSVYYQLHTMNQRLLWFSWKTEKAVHTFVSEWCKEDAAVSTTEEQHSKGILISTVCVCTCLYDSTGDTEYVSIWVQRCIIILIILLYLRPHWFACSDRGGSLGAVMESLVSGFIVTVNSYNVFLYRDGNRRESPLHHNYPLSLTQRSLRYDTLENKN